MEEMRKTLSFSIIKILGTEATSGGGKSPRVAGDDAAEDRAVSSSPSNSSSYELEQQTHNRLKTGITMILLHCMKHNTCRYTIEMCSYMEMFK